MIRFCPIKSLDLKLSCKTYWYIRIVNSQSSTSTSCSIVTGNMPSTRRHSYDLNFKLKIVAEAEAVNNNREIASKVSRLLWQWKRTAKNSHRKSYSKVFGSWISTRHQGCKFQCTRKAGWTKKVCFISTLFIQRRNFSSERQTRFSEFETVLLSWISCYWARAVKHVLSNMYVYMYVYIFIYIFLYIYFWWRDSENTELCYVATPPSQNDISKFD